MQKILFVTMLTMIIVMTNCKKINSISDPQGPVGESPLLTPIGTPVGTSVSKTIGTLGGSLISPDGRLKLNIPAGALNSNTDITIQPVTNEAPGGLGLAYDLLPNGTKFSKPVTLTFHYTDAEVPDNIPYFLFITYQDSSRAWVADYIQRDFDTVAKTVSLEVNHFTHYSFITVLGISADPLVLGEDEGTTIVVKDAVMDKNGRITVIGTVDKKFIDVWKVNGKIDGNNTDGRIVLGGSLPALPMVIYRSPAQIDIRRTVRVSVLLKGKFDAITRIYKKGKRIDIVQVERAVDITLEPSRFDYSVKIHYEDPEVFGYHSGLKQVYEDSASFDLRIRKIKGDMGQPLVRVSDSNRKNHPPIVKPKTQTYSDGFSTFTWEWIPDDIGVMNITAITLTGYDTTTSIVNLLFEHSGTMKPGYKWSTSVGGSGTQAPTSYGTAKQGLPSRLDLKLLPKDQTFKLVHGTGNVQISCVFKR